MQGFNHRKLDKLERNLMRGVFVKKMKDFEEQLAEESKNSTLLERLTGKVKKVDSSGLKLKSPNKPGFREDSEEINNILQEESMKDLPDEKPEIGWGIEGPTGTNRDKTSQR